MEKTQEDITQTNPKGIGGDAINLILQFFGKSPNDIQPYQLDLSGTSKEEGKHVDLSYESLKNKRFSDIPDDKVEDIIEELNMTYQDSEITREAKNRDLNLIIPSNPMINAKFISFKGSDLSDANLTHVYLSGADLSDAIMVRSKLTISSLEDADLTKADLTGADLTGADLLQTKVSDKQFNINYPRTELLEQD